jgi:adenylate cyclase
MRKMEKWGQTWTDPIFPHERQVDIQPVIDWLIEGAKPATDARHALSLLCRRILECGLRLDRLAVFVRPLHPNVVAHAYYWRHGSDEVERTDEEHGFMETDEALASPIRVVRASRQESRRRLAGPGAADDFPVLAELRQDGVTDYLIAPLEFLSGEVNAVSFATRCADGFSDAEIAAIRRLKPALTRIVEIFGLSRKAGNILDAYLGRHAGAEVLRGQIQRGDAEQIHAVIWFCDLRDSTPLADSMTPQAFLALLNQYFECVLDPVLEREGQVLRFIGDAALAIFPAGQDAADAAGRAVDAAQDAIRRMQALNEQRTRAGAAPLRFGIGLHLGDVLYGNMGTRRRIEFTVVGAAANEAARIEALCKTLDTPLLVSEPVAARTRRDWRPLGSYELRGVGKTVELFTL